MKSTKTCLVALCGFVVTLFQTASANPGFGNAISFNGSNQYVTIPNFGSILPTNEITVEFWANTTQFTGQSAFQLSPDNDLNRFNVHLNYGSSYGDALTYWDFGNINLDGRLFTACPPDSISNWVHYALVASESNNYMRIYTNGVLQISQSGMTPFARGSFDLQIGGPAFAYNGWLDELRVWNVARSDSEIRADLATQLTGNEPGLVAYYRFDSVSGNVATNSAAATGAAFNGILTNSPAWGNPSQPVVLNANDSGAGSLRQAIAAAGSSLRNVITFDPTLSGATITLTSGEIGLTKNLTLDGSSLADGITLNGNASSRIFHANGATVALRALTLKNATASGAFGGAILSEGSTLIVENCTFTGNSALTGAGISSDTLLIVNQCTFSGNSGTQGGGITCSAGTATINQSTISGNQTTSDSGGIASFGILNLTNSIVASNTAPVASNLGQGGGSQFNGANNLVGGNPQLAALGSYGGPTQTMPPLPGSPAIDTGSNAATNSFATDQRGLPRRLGAQVDIGAAEANLAPVVSVAADSGAGSLRQAVSQADADAVITFAPGLSGRTILLTGGQIVLGKNVTVDGSALANGIQLDGNHTDRIFLVQNGVVAVLKSLTIIHGNSAGDGGGIYNSGTLTVEGCTIAENSASKFFDGGGIFNQGGLTLLQSTIHNNTAYEGGGVRSVAAAFAATNCTFANNRASYVGGGISLADTGPTGILSHVTISGNSADGSAFGGGGGLFIYNQSTLLINSVVAGNRGIGGLDLAITYNTISFEGNNIVPSLVTNLATTTGPGPINQPPLLAPLGNYGGPTQTMPPLPGSPAIDAGTELGLTTDQRGFSRQLDGDTNGVAAPDLGAVELEITAPLAGSYRGLFYENAGVSQPSSGYFSASLTSKRKFSANLNLAGKNYPFSGKFDGLGRSSNSIPRRGLSPLAVRLFSVVTNGVVGLISDGTWTAELNSDRATFNSKKNPAPQAARYTMHIPGGTNATLSPHGDGFGAVTVDKNGKVILAGTLADGTVIAQSTFLSPDGQWPLYVSVNSRKGSILSWASFNTNAPKSFGGDLVWIRQTNSTTKPYPSGFTNQTVIAGTQYSRPPAGTRIVNFTAGLGRFDGGDFSSNNVTFTLGTNNKISNPSDSKFTLTFDTTKGLFSGKVTDPLTLKTVSYKGAVDQATATGHGFFINTNQSGSVLLGTQ